jgi:hypothetical protein
MKKFFTPNITRAGRIARAIFAALLLVGGILAVVNEIVWLGVLLFLASAFVFFEAARGWFVMRACGIKTKM